MKFTNDQIQQLIYRCRQTPEELLYDFTDQKVQRYQHFRNNGQICGIAHCDYVKSAWSYPQLLDDATLQSGAVDDRVGVWILLDVLPKMKGMPKFDTILTDDEESGESTAQFVPEFDYNWTFQFDRHGMDFVDYGYASPEFRSAFSNTTGILHAEGSFSDICYLPHTFGSRVNIGCGYYHEHHPDAWVDLDECARQVEAFVLFARKYSIKRFPAPVHEKITSDGFADFDEDDLLMSEAALPADTDAQSLRAWLAEMAGKKDEDLGDFPYMVD